MRLRRPDGYGTLYLLTKSGDLEGMEKVIDAVRCKRYNPDQNAYTFQGHQSKFEDIGGRVARRQKPGPKKRKMR